MQFRQLKHFSSLRLSQFSKIVPIKMAYLRYAVCGCCLCIKNANCYILGEDVKWCGGCARRRGAGFFFWSSGLRSARARGRAGFFFKLVRAPVARIWVSLLVKRLALRAGGAGLVFSLSWFSRRWRGADFILSVKWLCAPRGPEVGRGVSTPPSLPLDSTLPATS